MRTQIIIERILMYYDTIQLFIGIDKVQMRYLCILYADPTGGEYYLGVKATTSRLASLLSGNIDLRYIYCNPEIEDEYFRFDVSGENEFSGITITDIQEYMLPEEGIVLSTHQDDAMILKEQIDYNKPIIHFGLVDKNNSHNIKATQLSKILDSYQSFVTHGHKKLNEKANDTDYELSVFCTSAASFNIHMYVNTELDLFGNSKIEGTLELIDQIFDFEDEIDFTQNLSRIKGYAISNFKTLLQDLITNDIYIKYKWATPNVDSKIISKVIGKEKLISAYNIIIKTSDLETDTSNYSGYFLKVDSTNGDWKFYDVDNDKTIKGKCKTPDLLAGTTVQTANYQIICTVKSEKQNITEKLTSVNFLENIIKL